MNTSVCTRAVLIAIGIAFALSGIVAQSDPVCADCASKNCTYEKNLQCSCTNVSRVITIVDSGDREYTDVSLGFAIDDTGSMSGVIESVKSTVQGVVVATSAIFDKFVLATFNDPYVFNLTESRDPVVIGNFVNSVRANAGGDCPEMALTGIRDVASRVAAGSAIFAFTDASAKDFALEAEVKALLLAKDIRLNVLATGSLCGDGAELVRLVNATRGSIYWTPVQWDVQYVMNYIRNYAKFGIRYIRGMPGSLDELKILTNATCSCNSSPVRNLICLSPQSRVSNNTSATSTKVSLLYDSEATISGLHWAASCAAAFAASLQIHAALQF